METKVFRNVVFPVRFIDKNDQRKAEFHLELIQQSWDRGHFKMARSLSRSACVWAERALHGI